LDIVVRSAERILFLRDFDHFAAFVLAAVRTRPVRQLLLMTVGALRQPRLLEPVVRAAVAAAGG